DVGARFLSRVMARFTDKKLTVLVATSGDTGSAVANGFLGLENIDVVILYPSGKISKLQEKQLTTLGQNIRALEVKGTFDDCQDMVKSAFLDDSIQSQRPLSSANSINLARWMPQGIYFAWAVAQSEKENPVIAVPSGNFGNLASGMLMEKMGMPVTRFIAATNLNDAVPRFLKGEEYTTQTSVSTISNAMDVGDPSNFIRMVHLSGNEQELRNQLTGYACDDTTTREWMRRCYQNFNYVCDPHGAIGYGALRSNLNVREHGIFMETAHPAKFGDVVEPTLNIKVEVPSRLQDCLSKKKEATLIEASTKALKEYLLSR
ncbi:MAG: threonine synthase, partial [Flavobacteriales bacterium]